MKYSEPLWAAGFVLLAVAGNVLAFTHAETLSIAIGLVGVVLALIGGILEGVVRLFGTEVK